MLTRLALLCVTATGCTQLFGLDAPMSRRSDAAIDTSPADTPDAPSGPRQKPITIDGNMIFSDLTNFPLWVEIEDTDLQTTDSMSFIDDKGAALDFEITQHNRFVGRLRGWVRVPQLMQGVEYRLYLRLTPGSDGTKTSGQVFSNAFAAVWHLDDELLTAAIADATLQRAGTAAGGLGPADSVNGQLGMGIDFDGSTNAITFTNPYAGSSVHTVSAWVDARTASNYDCIVSMGTGTTNQARWIHTVWMSGSPGVGFFANDWQVPGLNLQNAGWKLVHWTFGPTGSRLYVDGTLAAGPHLHSGGINTIGTTGTIGNAPTPLFGTSPGLAGTLDEVRLATVERTAGWIATEFANQSSPSTFYTVGPAEPVP